MSHSALPLQASILLLRQGDGSATYGPLANVNGTAPLFLEEWAPEGGNAATLVQVRQEICGR